MTRTNPLSVLLPVCLALMTTQGCVSGEDPDPLADGGTSEQGNALKVAVVDAFGQPVIGARVTVLPEDWIPLQPPSPEGELPRAFFAATDSTGTASGQLASGSYAVSVEFGDLRSFVRTPISKGSLQLRLEPLSPIALSGIVSGTGIDSLFVPGTGIAAVVGTGGRFEFQSLPFGVRTLSLRDGRRIVLDSIEAGFQAEFRSGILPGQSAILRPDSTWLRYVPVLASPLPRVQRSPTGRLQAWVPDTVLVVNGTLVIEAVGRRCRDLPMDGISGWHHADTLDLFRLECPGPAGEHVRRRFTMDPLGVWTVSTLEPLGYTWELP